MATPAENTTVPAEGMRLYDVTTVRTEIITFRLLARDAEDAENRYMMDGDEIRSKSPAEPDVDSVVLATDDD